MKILITGSKGFIGTNMLHYFNQHLQHEVYGCDVFTNYNEKNFFLIDISNPAYHTLFHNPKFDLCINCAGAASVPESLKFPERDYELNTHLVFKLLNAIRLYNPECKFINISSAAVYGNPDKLPIAEKQFLKPLSPYGLHKMYAEQLCLEFAKYYKIKTSSVRVFSAYGPGLKKQIFWDLYMKSKNTSHVELFGTGKETRDYIFVNDIAQALDCLIKHGLFEGECYNLGYGSQYTLEYVANLFFKKLNWKGELSFSGKTRTGDPDYWQADITLLKNIGFIPHVTIEEGLNKYAEWIKGLPLE